MAASEDVHFGLIGISHKTAPVEVRETVSLDEAAVCTMLTSAGETPGVAERVILSTCNRTEIYCAVSGDWEKTSAAIINGLLNVSGAPVDVRSSFYCLDGDDVIEHLFKVVAGLDSMILGEPQIFGQVKNAYSLACDIQATGPTINRLFHHAFRVGKLIRNLTSIGEGAVSVSFAAVKLAKGIFGDLTGRSVLLVGAGKMSELCAQNLADYGVEKLTITNRTIDRAETLARKLGGQAVPFADLESTIPHVDILITSVAAKEPVIRAETLRNKSGPAGNAPLFIIDLGVPRNVDPGIKDIDGVFLYNIDDLEGIALENIDHRKSEAEKAESLIEREVEEFRMWLSGRHVIPVIRTLHARCENIRLNEIEKIRHRISGETFEALDIVTRRIVRKILHNPVIAMRAAESAAHRERLVSSIRDLFMNGHEDKQRNT